MDLRKYNPTPGQVEKLKHVQYQPYILTDNCRMGAGYSWITKKNIYLMEKDAPPPEWELFSEHNDRMIKMYGDWMDAVRDTAGSLKDMTVIDTACCAGYFLLGLLDRGAKRAVGYDIGNFTDYFQTLNEVTGRNIEFINEPYDMYAHEIKDAIQGDVVISTAIMLHLSDPTYYLAFIGKITKKILLVFTSVDDEKDHRITYHGRPRAIFKNPFPICFDNRTSISRSLLEFGLKECGFTSFHEIPYQADWVPMSFYQHYKTYIAVK